MEISVLQGFSLTILLYNSVFDSFSSTRFFLGNYKIFSFLIDFSRSDGCGGKMKTDAGSIKKNKGSVEGTVAYLLTHPFVPHVFSFGPFVTNMLDSGCQPKALGN